MAAVAAMTKRDAQVQSQLPKTAAPEAGPAAVEEATGPSWSDLEASFALSLHLTSSRPKTALQLHATVSTLESISSIAEHVEYDTQVLASHKPAFPLLLFITCVVTALSRFTVI